MSHVIVIKLLCREYMFVENQGRLEIQVKRW